MVSFERHAVYIVSRSDNRMILGVFYDCQAAINYTFAKPFYLQPCPVDVAFFAGRRNASFSDGNTRIEKLWIDDSGRNQPELVDIKQEECDE